MAVVTIRGHYGSYATDIAREVAGRLGVRLLDHEILVELAKRLEVPVEQIEDLEHVPLSLKDRILYNLGRNLEGSWAMAMGPTHIGTVGLAAYYEHLPTPVDEAAYKATLEEIIHDLATDDSVVFAGKGTQVVLSEHEAAIHTFVTAPLEVRVRRIMQRHLLDQPKEAQALIEELDGQRRAYLKRYFGVDMEDLSLYDLVFNTAKVSQETAVETILRVSQEVG